ncbi:galectin-3-like [Homarus americanus]|uniref:galectin-3-like n=1 Tax=Homarus americanus TaxID=6706 RepID=UPI001C471E5B|nr:galectin-3-like [Homarus americanus]
MAAGGATVPECVPWGTGPGRATSWRGSKGAAPGRVSMVAAAPERAPGGSAYGRNFGGAAPGMVPVGVAPVKGPGGAAPGRFLGGVTPWRVPGGAASPEKFSCDDTPGKVKGAAPVCNAPGRAP